MDPYIIVHNGLTDLYEVCDSVGTVLAEFVFISDAEDWVAEYTLSFQSRNLIVKP
jgi:hypothetical protein